MDANALLAILGMGLVTYLTRIGGLWLVRRNGLPPTLERTLSFLPGAVLISILAPIAVRSGPGEWLGLALTVFLAKRTGSLALALVVGVAFVAAWRHFIQG
jgi:uncharacterized membrane protein